MFFNFSGDGVRATLLIGSGLIVAIVLASILLWNESPSTLRHVSDVAGAIAPILTFLTVLVGATGWIVSARLNGDESCRTEHMKLDQVP